MTERDYYGSTAFHVAAASVESGFARWFLALRFLYEKPLRERLEQYMGIGTQNQSKLSLNSLFTSDHNSCAIHNSTSNYPEMCKSNTDVTKFNTPPHTILLRDISAALTTQMVSYLLDVASSAGIDTVELLTNSRDSQGLTPIMLSCMSNTARVLHVYLHHIISQASLTSRKMLTKNGILESEKWENRNCLDIAAARGFVSVEEVWRSNAMFEWNQSQIEIDSQVAMEKMMQNEGHHHIVDHLKYRQTMALKNIHTINTEDGDVIYDQTTSELLMKVPALLTMHSTHKENIEICYNCGWSGIPSNILIDWGLLNFHNTSDGVVASDTNFDKAKNTTLTITKKWLTIFDSMRIIPGQMKEHDFSWSNDVTNEYQGTVGELIQSLDEPVLMKRAALQLPGISYGAFERNKNETLKRDFTREKFIENFGDLEVCIFECVFLCIIQ